MPGSTSVLPLHGALPNRLDQLGLAHDPDHVERLRFDVNDLAGTPQLVPSNIDLNSTKQKLKASLVEEVGFSSPLSGGVPI